ncbi:hypothetical protein B9G53_01115 [Pseudanabaena sp. SR411]|uniref:hypothetical protein n=1 Tax=Pseudanabaena sp. SR411 TaxID=1980935 RepID=UPI000B97FDAE|nr:hypothetical protein [Pseudanabaena sp. SR411]OYQ67583.1 hypothetical protein B9G53_01115 [Pseudanabaena sp. SR411]
MTDLTFGELNDALGEDAFSVSGSELTIDLNLLMGESSIALTDQKVAEFLTNLLDVAAAAQETFNANVANTTKLASYPQPISGVPSVDTATGDFYVSSTYSFNSRAPLNKAATTAVTA